MKTQNFKYGNNGVYPFRYAVRRGRSLAANVNYYENEETGEIVEVNLNENSLKNLSRGFKTCGVSLATRRKIAKSSRMLSLASTPRKVRHSSGEYRTHLISFITLTLPSPQVHEDSEITKHVLGTFLDRGRKLGIFENYVWRAEKQKNGNIHYHLLTDSYASFSMIQNLWFISLRKFGYLQAYAEKFQNMSFADYSNLSFNKDKSVNEIAGSYARGKRSNWQKPPACHVQSIDSVSAVIKYVAKYVAKEDSENENIVTGRSWGCSQSVSSLTKDFTSTQELSKDWYHAGAEIMRRKVINTDFFSMVIFKITSLCAWFPEVKKTIEKIVNRHFQPCNFYLNSLGMFPA